MCVYILGSDQCEEVIEVLVVTISCTTVTHFLLKWPFVHQSMMMEERAFYAERYKLHYAHVHVYITM